MGYKNFGFFNKWYIKCFGEASDLYFTIPEIENDKLYNFLKNNSGLSAKDKLSNFLAKYSGFSENDEITIIITEDSIKKNQKYHRNSRKAFTVFVVGSIGIIGSVIAGIAFGVLKTKKKNKKKLNKQI